MPPIRWTLMVLITFIFLSRRILYVNAMHDTVSLSSDGWRPIVGKSQLELQDEITLYKNPSQTDENSEPVKAQTPSVVTPSSSLSTKPYHTISATQAASGTSNNIKSGNKHPTVKTHQHQKHYKPFHLTHGHGPHIPLTPLGYKGSPHRIPIPNKHGPFMMSRPVRGPHPGGAIAHSIRNEVILPAPSAAIGSFAVFNNHPPGFPKKSYPNMHGLNDPVFQHLPVQSYLIQNRNPVQIDGNNVFNHNDEYTRNLVPPPYKEYQPVKEKNKPLNTKEQSTVATESSSTINNPTLIIGKHKDAHQRHSESVLVQLAPTFEHSHFELQPQKVAEHKPIEIQVTKEKLNVFHNSIPNNYNPQGQYEPQFFQNRKPNEEIKIYSYEIEEPLQAPRKPIDQQPIPIFEHKLEIKKSSEAPHFPTYEVTEEKQWQDPPSFYSTRPSVIKQQPQNLPPQPEIVFLPTPYRSESSLPTSPTQSEVSAIYSQVNLRNRQRHPEVSTDNSYFFNIKEVSTHYPIIGKPESPTIFSIPANVENTEFSNDITGSAEEKTKVPQIYQPVEEPEPTTNPPPVRDWQEHRHRPQQRRRRPPQRLRTTTEEPITVTEYNVMKLQNSEESNYSAENNRPQRRRRPSRVRTTTSTTTQEPPVPLTITSKQRHRIKYEGNRIRLPSSAESTEELPMNHKLTEPISYSVMQPIGDTYISSEIIHPSAENLPKTYENDVTKVESKFENLEIQTQTENYLKDEVQSGEENPTFEYEPSVRTEPTTTAETTTQRKRLRFPSTALVTEPQPVTIPIRNVEVSSAVNYFEPSKEFITIQEIYNRETEIPNYETTTIPPTTTTLSTTTVTTTTSKSHRIRSRPAYDNKNRPRFSVKEYRQRLNQYSSSSTSETPVRSSTEAPLRSRFPNRSRKPFTPSQDNETTERNKFTPKEPRHSTTQSSNSENTAERKTNVRLRPFGRQKTTTESTTTQKISIKPNIFSNLRRPTPTSLRQRIYSKHNRTNILEKSTTSIKEEESSTEKPEITHTPVVDNLPDYSSDSIKNKVLEVQNSEEENDEVTNTELMKNDIFLQSQRVSDLTSSAHKEYETPGLFKSVSPNTRIVPSYFTLSTDDPILPIEAFFPNLKDKSMKNEY